MAPTDKHSVLAEFRKQLEQDDLIHDGDTIGTDDETLLRFLRARNFNLKQSTLMWKNCQHWRSTVQNVGIDELYRQIDPMDYPERDIVFDSWPLYFHKTDKEGHPLNFHHFGGINLNKLQEKMSMDRFWQAFVVNCELLPREILPAASEAAGKRIPGTFVVVDLSGFGISQFWHMKDHARNSFQISQDYFPETVARLAIINAPRGFSTIWNVMKPWIAKETASKVNIMGSDYKSKLLELIDEDALPAKLGGKCTCEGSGGCMKSNAGPWMHNRQQRREAWLKGERSTIAILPGELSGKKTSVDEEPQNVTESTSSGEVRSNLSETSSETSSIATPPPSESQLAPHEKYGAEMSVRGIHEHSQETAVPAA